MLEALVCLETGWSHSRLWMTCDKYLQGRKSSNSLAPTSPGQSAHQVFKVFTNLVKVFTKPHSSLPPSPPTCASTSSTPSSSIMTSPSTLAEEEVGAGGRPGRSRWRRCRGPCGRARDPWIGRLTALRPSRDEPEHGGYLFREPI